MYNTSVMDASDILSNQILFQDYCLEKTRNQEAQKQEFIINNYKMAKTNKQKQVEIDGLKQRIYTLQQQNIKHRQILDELLQVQNREQERFSIQSLAQQLRQLITSSEDETESTTLSYLQGKLTDQEFLQAFKETRKLYHSRNSKLEHLLQIKR